MSVKLRKRKNTDGTTSLRLDIYHNGKHTIETLKHLQLTKQSNPKDREDNKSKIQKAEAICLQRALELEGNNYNVKSNLGKNTIVTVWMQSYIDSYTKKDKRNMQGALNRFSDFLTNKKNENITFENLDAIQIESFMEYLEKRSVGEGAKSYFSRFKKMIHHAYRTKIINTNIIDFIERKIKGIAREKDILLLEEIIQLSKTPNNNEKIRNAFLFSSLTGLRWADIKVLTWRKINLENKTLNIKQGKTGTYVSINLNEASISLLGKKGLPNELVFELPSANGANKNIKAWVRRAGIDKHITWHNARHSFGTNLILMDETAFNTQILMGHATMQHTERYIKKAKQIKLMGTDRINIKIKINTTT